MTMSSMTIPLRPSASAVAAKAAGAAALATMLAIGLRVATAATTSAAYLVPSGRRTGYPAWMRGPLRGAGAPLPIHGFILLMAAMVVAWVVALICARALPVWLVAGATVAATAIFTLAPPLLSTDVFNYIAYGQMGAHGINPYLHGPVALHGQPVYGYTGHLWKRVPSAYGPVFTWLSYPLSRLGLSGALWSFKALTGAACLASAGFVWATARRLGVSPAFAVVLLALNPLVLVYAVGGAHNDVVLAAVVAASIYLAVSGRAAGAGVALALALGIKLSAGLALPFVLLGVRPRWRALAAFAAGAVVLGAASLLAFGPGIAKMVDALTMQQRFHWIVVSVPTFVAHYLGLGHPSHAARVALTAVPAAIVVALVARARGGRGWLEGGAAAALVVLATTAWVLPWYIVWALPFAALVRMRALPVAAVILSVLLMAMQLDHYVLTHATHRPHRHAHHVTRVTHRV
jgi:Glycosyltransferase family 87